MKEIRSRTQRPRKRGPDPYAGEAPLDAIAREAIELFALLLTRCNFSRRSAARYFENCLNALPLSVGLPSDSLVAPAKDHVPADVLTQWHLLPQYVLNGQPRPLRAKGSRASVASIVRRVNPRSDPDRILEYLLSIGAVKRVGDLYIPRERIVQHRLSPRLQRIHHARLAVSLLRTLERNTRQSTQGRWYQFATDGTVPESQLEDFSKQMWEASDQMLMLADAALFRRALTRRRGERSVPVTLGIFMSEGRRLAPLHGSASQYAGKKTSRSVDKRRP
jgi:hypothetical protein